MPETGGFTLGRHQVVQLGGCEWFVCNGTAYQYPAGDGASTTTAGNSITLNATKVVVERVVHRAALPTADRVLTLESHDGTQVLPLLMDMTVHQPLVVFAEFNGGIRAKADNADVDVAILFRRIR